MPVVPSIVICIVVEAPFKSPDFHLPAKPGPPDTRASVDVCWTDLPSGLTTSETHIKESPLSETFDLETTLPLMRNVNSQDVGLNSLPTTPIPLGMVYSFPVRSKSASNPPPL